MAHSTTTTTTTSGHFSALREQGKSRRELIKPGMDRIRVAGSTPSCRHNPLVSSTLLPFYYDYCVCVWEQCVLRLFLFGLPLSTAFVIHY